MKRCYKCKRLRIIGLGWQKLWWDLYCPKCMALLRAERLANEEASEPKARGEFARLNAMREELWRVAEGRVALPECLRGACVELAARALHEVQQQAASALQNIEPETETEWYEADGKVGGKWFLKAQQLDYVAKKVDPVLVPIHGLLSDLVAQGDCTDARTLVANCLALARVVGLDPRYFDFNGGFPVDQLVALATRDRGATVEALCAALSTPGEKAIKRTSAAVRSCVIVALGKIGDPRARTALLTVLEEEDAWGSWASSAACALSDMGDDAVVIPVVRSVRQFASGNYVDWNSRDYIAERLGKWVRAGTTVYEELARIRKEGYESPRLADPDKVDVPFVIAYVANTILKSADRFAGTAAA